MSVLQVTSVQVFEDQWITWARKPNGRLPSGRTALEALIEARARAGRRDGPRHAGCRGCIMRSLERFAFDSALLPYNFTMPGIDQSIGDVPFRIIRTYTTERIRRDYVTG